MKVIRVLVLACLGGLAVGATPAFAAFPGDNGRILFESDRSGYDIWTMTATGGDLLDVTQDSEAIDAAGRWRADGRKIAFMSDRETPTNPTPTGSSGPDFELFVMNSDGSNARQLTFNELDDEFPAWSPNGKKIVFQRDLDPVRGQADYDIFAVDLKGRAERNLTNSPGINEAQASWSPQGARIAFESDRDGDPEIYTMNQSGSHVQQLTSNEFEDGAPNWSPDGKKIVFMTSRLATEEVFNLELFAMRADGSGQVNLTRNPAVDLYGVWSPDGRQIAFVSERDASEENPFNTEIYTMSADGSNQVNRTNNAAFDFYPDWQPLGGRGDSDTDD